MIAKKEKKIAKPAAGEPGYLNRNCWLIRSLNYSPYDRCKYCELHFHKCLFLQYQVISLILIAIFFTLFFILDGKISVLVVVCVFTFIIVYGFVLNKSMDKIIKANFSERKTAKALAELSDKLELRVKEQTKDIQAKAQELEKKNIELNKLLQVKNEFLRIVNHQLNTPTSIIKNAVFMMNKKEFTEEKGIEFIDEGLRRIDIVLRDFWKAFAVDGEGVKLTLAKTDLVAMIQKIVADAERLSDSKKRGLEIKIVQEGSIPEVKTDFNQAARAITNILDNAITYTPQGSVTITLDHLNKDFVKVSIADTGFGIDKKDQKNLFEKFFRGSHAKEYRPAGSGLGLYIAQGIIKASGGQLKLEKTAVDLGTTFSLTLPIWK